MNQADLFETHSRAGEHASCARCGDLCVIAAGANLAGRPLKFASGENGGECGSCAITLYLKSDEMDVSELLPPGYSAKEALSAPHIQSLFTSVLKVGRSDLAATAINWEKVIANWDL